MPYITHPLYTVANKQTAGRGVGAGPEADWTLTETSQFVVERRGKNETSGCLLISPAHTRHDGDSSHHCCGLLSLVCRSWS